VNEVIVVHHLAGLGFTGFITDEEIARITAMLNAPRDFRDENITAVTD
jgi:hypothetical protein